MANEHGNGLRWLAAMGALACCALLPGVAAAQQPDFTGVWST